MKRFFDILFSLILILALSPLFLLITLVVWLETGLSPLYIQKRSLTYKHRVFNFYKFRTMHLVPPDVNAKDDTITLKFGLDVYVTRFGKYLRRSGLDELPQLINVLKGEMSFVGPRPLQVSDIELLKSDYPDLYNKRSEIKSRPGITGYWQLFGDRLAGVKNMLELELYYERHKSLTLIFFILVETVPVMVFARHFDAIVSFRKEEYLRWENEKVG